MKRTITLAAALLFGACSLADAQQQRRGRQQQPPSNAMVDNPLAVGESGVAWYTTWDTGLAEAKRSNRPIMFMSAATTCSGVSGVF